MSETYVKKNDNTLTVTRTTDETHIVEEDRAEIQTQIDHLKFDKNKAELEYKIKIGVLEAKIVILDS